MRVFLVTTWFWLQILNVFKIVSLCRIDDVVWNGENISVLKEVTIYPPYRPEDVKGNTDSQALKHVRKIVSKTFTLILEAFIYLSIS